MKQKIIKDKYIIVGTVAILIFLIVLKDVLQYDITNYDNWAYSVFVEDLRTNEITLVMIMITSFCNLFVLIGIIVLLLLLIKNKKIGIMALTNLILVYLLNSFVKFIIQRPRPSGYNLITESNYSFPSGHAMVATGFYGYFIYLVYKYVGNKILKYSLIVLLFLLIVLICISRIYLGVHYLSDTIAGFFLSITYLMIFIVYTKKIVKDGKYEG